MSRTVPETIAQIIGEKTQAEHTALAGGTVFAQNGDYVLALPDGHLYLISIRPAHVSLSETRRAATPDGASTEGDRRE